MSENDAKKINETPLALDVMKYAYRDTDGVLYSIDKDGKRVVAPEGTPALSAEYQKAADQTAGIMMIFKKVKHLDEKERGMFDEAMKKGADAVAGMTDKVRALVDEANARRKEAGIKIYGEDAAGIIGAVKDGAMLPVNAIAGIFETGSKIMDQFGGADLTEEQAKSIGTAYASAAQVATETGKSSIGDYLMAAIKFAVSTVCGWVNHEGDVWGLNKKDATWDGLLKDEGRDNYHERVQKSLEQLPEIGGQKTTTLGFLNRDDSVIMTKDGSIQVIDSSDASNPAPHFTGEGVETPKNPEEVKKKLKETPLKSDSERALDIVKEKMGTIANSAKDLAKNPVAATVGVAVTADIAHGVARGTMSMMVGEKSVSAMRYKYETRKGTALKAEADAVRAGGSPIKNVWGKVTGHTLPDPVRADMLDKEAAAAEAKAAPKADPFKNRVIEREALLGKNIKTFAESESILTHIHPKLGKYDIFNRGGALLGKGIGTIGSNLMTIAEKGAHKSGGAKMVYGMDAIQGGFALLQGDMHGVTENAAQIGGGWAGSKYGTAAAEAAIIRFVPGKFKPLAVAGVGLLSFFGGRKLGELGSNLISPKAEAVEASVQTAASAEFSKLDETLLAQGVNVRLVGGDQINALRTLANTPEAYTQMVAQLEQQGVISGSILTPEQKVSAVKSLQKMVQLDDTVKKEASKEQRDAEKKMAKVSAISEGAEVGFNASVVGTGIATSLRTLGPLASGASKAAAFIPGPIRTGIMAVGDVYHGVTAAGEGNTKAVAHSAGRVAGGLITAIGAGAGTGAAIGAIGGITAVPAAIIGGIVGAAGYYFGSKAGGSIADSITGYDENAPAPTTVASTTTTNPLVETHPGIAAALQNQAFVASMKSDKEVGAAIMSMDFKKLQGLAMRHGQMLAINGAKSSIGSVAAPTGSSTPVNTQAPSIPFTIS